MLYPCPSVFLTFIEGVGEENQHPKPITQQANLLEQQIQKEKSNGKKYLNDD